MQDADFIPFRNDPWIMCNGHGPIERRPVVIVGDDLQNDNLTDNGNHRDRKISTFFSLGNNFSIENIFHGFIHVWIVSSCENQTYVVILTESVMYLTSAFFQDQYHQISMN